MCWSFCSSASTKNIHVMRLTSSMTSASKDFDNLTKQMSQQVLNVAVPCTNGIKNLQNVFAIAIEWIYQVKANVLTQAVNDASRQGCLLCRNYSWLDRPDLFSSNCSASRGRQFLPPSEEIVHDAEAHAPRVWTTF